MRNPFFSNFSFNQYQRTSFKSDFVNFFKQKGFLQYVIISYLVFFILYLLGKVAMRMFVMPIRMQNPELEFDFFRKYLELTPDFTDVINYPWIVISHAFVNVSFFKLLYNVIILYIFGIILLQFFKQSRIAVFYFSGLIGGILFYYLSFLLIPNFEEIRKSSIIIGTSAPVYALMTGAMIMLPDYTFVVNIFLKPKIRYLVFLILIIEIFTNMSNNDIFVAHAGGIVAGVLVGLFYRNLGFRFTSFKMPKVPKFRKSEFKAEKISHSRPLTDEEYLDNRKERKDKIDVILDKISKYGYQKLTAEEKEFLFNQKKNN